MSVLPWKQPPPRNSTFYFLMLSPKIIYLKIAPQPEIQLSTFWCWVQKSYRSTWKQPPSQNSTFYFLMLSSKIIYLKTAPPPNLTFYFLMLSPKIIYLKIAPLSPEIQLSTFSSKSRELNFWEGGSFQVYVFRYMIFGLSIKK